MARSEHGNDNLPGQPPESPSSARTSPPPSQPSQFQSGEPQAASRRPRSERPGRPPRFHRSQSHASAHADFSPEPSPRCDHPLTTHSAPILVTQPDQLSEILQHLRSAGTFAFDSEFIGELTYIPQLCLIQVASSTRVALIDPLAKIDLRPFWELVADPSVQKIVHAGQQDVEPVFRALDRPPANLFDTQIAGGFIGLGYPLSLSKLVGALVGVRLTKGLTFTHWDRRPLSEQQLRYAADDVRYLPALHHEISNRLQATGHTDWALAESAALANPSLYAFDPDAQYLKIRGGGTLSPRNLAVLRELTIWRDQAAQRDNVPPRTLLRDEVLVEIARSPLRSASDLPRVRGLPRPVEAHDGADLVAACARAMTLPEQELPTPPNHEPTPPEKFRADALFYAVQTWCAGRQIDPNLIASRQEIGELMRLWRGGEDPSSLRILRGWRKDAIGQQILDLLQGKTALHVQWTGDMLKSTIDPLQ
jgi:ribonuclease D